MKKQNTTLTVCLQWKKTPLQFNWCSGTQTSNSTVFVVLNKTDSVYWTTRSCKITHNKNPLPSLSLNLPTLQCFCPNRTKRVKGRAALTANVFLQTIVESAGFGKSISSGFMESRLWWRPVSKTGCLGSTIIIELAAAIWRFRCWSTRRWWNTSAGTKTRRLCMLISIPNNFCIPYSILIYFTKFMVIV